VFCTAQLNEQQLAAVRATLLRSLTEYEFSTELWTLKRVGAVIKHLHGARFGQTQVWRVLGSLGFTPHGRAQQAQQRSKASFDHRRLLDAGCPVAMS